MLTGQHQLLTPMGIQTRIEPLLGVTVVAIVGGVDIKSSNTYLWH